MSEIHCFYAFTAIALILPTRVIKHTESDTMATEMTETHIPFNGKSVQGRPKQVALSRPLNWPNVMLRLVSFSLSFISITQRVVELLMCQYVPGRYKRPSSVNALNLMIDRIQAFLSFLKKS